MSPSDSPDHPGSILYHSKSSEVPYLFHKPVTGQELFFCCFLQQTASSYYNLGKISIAIWDFSFLFLQEITKSQKRLLQLAKMLGFANKSSSVSQAIKEMNANKNMYFKSSDEILNQYIKELNIIKPRLKSIFDETEILNDRVYKVKVSIVTKGFYLGLKE